MNKHRNNFNKSAYIDDDKTGFFEKTFRPLYSEEWRIGDHRQWYDQTILLNNDANNSVRIGNKRNKLLMREHIPTQDMMDINNNIDYAPYGEYINAFNMLPHEEKHVRERLNGERNKAIDYRFDRFLRNDIQYRENMSVNHIDLVNRHTVHTQHMDFVSPYESK